VRAILADPQRRFAVARDHTQDRFRQGACANRGGRGGCGWRRRWSDELARAFAAAHGAFLVTNFWEHFSAERELKQAAAMARATRDASIVHAVWSTLGDTRLSFALDDSRLEADAIFAAEAAASCRGSRPRTSAGALTAIFRRGPEVVGQRFGVAGEVLSGPEYAATFSRDLGVPVSFYDMPFDDYRALGFPGADDMGNMYEHHAILGQEFRRLRSTEVARALNPALQSFDLWLSANASRLPLG
jgi:hypothetical protein